MPSLEGVSGERYLAQVLNNQPTDPASDGTARRHLVLWAKPWGRGESGSSGKMR